MKRPHSKTVKSLLDDNSIYEIETNLANLHIEKFHNGKLKEIKCKKIKALLRNKDPYVKYHLLVNIKAERIDLDEDDVNELSRILETINSMQLTPSLSVRDRILDLCLNKFKIQSIKGHIKILSIFDLDDDQIDKLRKYFGYDMIYKAFKDIIRDIYIIDYTVREIGLAMRLLNNEKLCYSQTLDTFSRLSEYLTKEIFDRNLISCCVVLTAIIVYSPNMVADKQDFLNGMIAYLLSIFFERSNFVFYNQRDTDILLNTIEALCKTACVQNSSYKLKIGFVRKCVFNIMLYMESSSSIYEEIMSFIATLRSLGYFIDLCYETVSDKDTQAGRFKVVVLGNDDQSKTKDKANEKVVTSESVGFIDTILTLIPHSLIEDLMKYRLPDNICLGYDDNEIAKRRFISAKYFSLDNIAKIKNVNINRVDFYNDVYAQSHPIYIFSNLNRLRNQISWSDLIILATHSEKKAEYIHLLLDGFYTKNIEHLSYIFLFVFSLKDDFDSLLLLTKNLTEVKVFDKIEKYWEILIYIYHTYRNVDDNRVKKTRLFIIKKMIETKEMLLKSLEILINDLQKEEIEINNNIYPLLYYLIFNLKKIDKNLFSRIYKFIIKNIKIGGCEGESEIIEETNTKKDEYVKLKILSKKFRDKIFTNETLNVSLLIHLMIVYKPTEDEIMSVFSFDNFFHNVAVSLYFKKECKSEDFIARNLFNFLLKCSNKHRRHLKIIFERHKKSKFLKCYNFLKKQI